MQEPPTTTPLANSTSGAPFSSGGITTASGECLPAGRIRHLHSPFAFLPSANNHQSSSPFTTFPSPFSPQLPSNMNPRNFTPHLTIQIPSQIPPQFCRTPTSSSHRSPPPSQLQMPTQFTRRYGQAPVLNPSMDPPHLSPPFRPCQTITSA
jgi:hypothetical protein